MKRAIAFAISGLMGFAGITWWALEAGGVAVIETRAPDGSRRATRVWFVEPRGALWLEAGSPENSWYRDALRNPRVSFSSRKRSGPYVAQRVADPAAHERIRSLIRAKYGVRDWWIGWIVDTSHSVAVALVPASGPAQRDLADPGSR